MGRVFGDETSPLVVNLFGAPGAGKSTGAAWIVSKLKLSGVPTELVTEFAKDKVWEGSREVFNNQLYIFGKQDFKLSRLLNKVDIAVTDSPLVLSIFYNKDETLGEEFNQLVLKRFQSYPSVNFFVNRTKEYVAKGRFQTEEESDVIEKDLKTLLFNKGICYHPIDGNELGYSQALVKVYEAHHRHYHLFQYNNNKEASDVTYGRKDREGS